MRPLNFLKPVRHIALRGRGLILGPGSRGLPLLQTISALLLLNLLSLSPVHALELTSDSTLATAGYFHLSWSDNDKPKQFELQESSDSGFSQYKTLYNGTDMGSVISGKSDGDYYYRIIADDQPSNTVSVKVRHHPLSRALGFFALGALVFLATLLVIFRGNKQQ